MESTTGKATGRAFLVGAGPGAVGLLTLRAKECLEAADVVLFDGLANEQILDFAADAECICVGKHGRQPIWPQEKICELLVERVAEGQRVVRLKGGDPGVFARTAEELAALAGAGLPFEVVPGVTAGLATASYAGIPLTHRDHASAVALVTAKQQASASPEEFDWPALARFPGTLVFYMGVTTAQWWTKCLIDAGKSPATPAAIVRRCTWSDQQVVNCRLDEVADTLTPASKMRPPVVVVVGEVAGLGDQWDWFAQLPLAGCGVWVTRPNTSSGSTREQLEELGATVFEHPSLEFESTPPERLADAVRALASGDFDGVTFTSQNAVRAFMTGIQALQLDSRIFAGVRLASVGPATASELQRYGLRADFTPEEQFNVDGLGELIAESIEGQGQRWLVVCPSDQSPSEPSRRLAARLEEGGAAVQLLETYRMKEPAAVPGLLTQALDAGKIHFVTATSPRVAKYAVEVLKDRAFPTGSSPVLVALSPAIENYVKKLGWPVIPAGKIEMASLINAIENAWNSRS